MSAFINGVTREFLYNFKSGLLKWGVIPEKFNSISVTFFPGHVLKIGNLNYFHRYIRK